MYVIACHWKLVKSPMLLQLCWPNADEILIFRNALITSDIFRVINLIVLLVEFATEEKENFNHISSSFLKLLANFLLTN
jgi:hypothetical protein